MESYTGRLLDVAIQPADQKIVAAGSPSLPGAASLFVSRYDTAGQADASYGANGVAPPALGPNTETVRSLVLQPDGKAVVAGRNNAALGIVRLTTNGAPDNTFGTGGWASLDVPSTSSDEAYSVALQSSGKPIVAGLSTASGSQTGIVARFTSSGAIDSGKNAFGQIVQGKSAGYAKASFGAPYVSFAGTVVQADDKVVAAGKIDLDGAHPQLLISRFTASGLVDTSFGTGGYAKLLPVGLSSLSASAVAIQQDGKIVVTGSCSGIDGQSDAFVARYLASGVLDTTFAGGAGFVRIDIDGTFSATREAGNDLAIQPDGKIVIAGSMRVLASTTGSSVLVARLNADGSLDDAFGSGGIKLGSASASTEYHGFEAYSVALQSDGSIIVAGADYRTTAASSAHPLLMRFNSSNIAPASTDAAAANDAALLSLSSDEAASPKKRK